MSCLCGTAIPSLSVALALLLSIVGLAAPTWADYEAGVQAFSRADYATALREWRPLAERGHAGAQYQLGLLYDFSKGVPQDFATARQWYEKAAAKGHAGAQHNLGGMYEFGHGVTRDDVLAYMWYHLAAGQPNGDEWRDLAAENRDGIAEHLTSVQIAHAKKRAQEWKLKGPAQLSNSRSTVRASGVEKNSLSRGASPHFVSHRRIHVSIINFLSVP